VLLVFFFAYELFFFCKKLACSSP